MSIWSWLMQFWRTLFERQTRPYRPQTQVVGVTQPTPTVVLQVQPQLAFQTLTVSPTTYANGTPSTATISNATGNSVIVGGNMPAGLTVNSAARTISWNGTGPTGSGTYTLYENFAGASTNPNASTISYSITGTVLGTLTLSTTAFVTGVTTDGTINGATSGSIITSSDLPASITINSAARTFHYDGTGAGGTFHLTETLSPYNPATSTINYTVSNAPANDGTAANAPMLSGTPREAEFAWTVAGNWTGGVNKYRYDVQADGVSLTGVSVTDNGTTSTVSFPYDTTSAAIEFTWPTSAVGHAPTLTVKASLDNGVNWSAAASAINTFNFPSDLITPASIPTPTLTRTSASGVLPMQFSIGGVDLYDSYQILLYHYASDGTTLKETSSINLSEAALTTPFNVDLSGNTDPVPVPVPSTMGANDQLTVRIVSGDYGISGNNVVGGVFSSTPTNISPTNTVTAMMWSSTDTTTGLTLVNGNLQANSTGAPQHGALRTNRGVSSGKFYVEYITGGGQMDLYDSAAVLGTDYEVAANGGTPSPHAVDYPSNTGTANYNTTSFASASWSGGCFTGSISGTTLTVATVDTGGTPFAVGKYIAGPSIPFGTMITALGTGTGGAGTYTLNNSVTLSSTGYLICGDVLAYAVDVTNNLVWFAHNNAWQNSGNPSAGTGGLSIAGIGNPVFPAARIFNGYAVALNPGTTPGGTAGFIFTPPTGFTAP